MSVRGMQPTHHFSAEPDSPMRRGQDGEIRHPDARLPRRGFQIRGTSGTSARNRRLTWANGRTTQIFEVVQASRTVAIRYTHSPWSAVDLGAYQRKWYSFRRSAGPGPRTNAPDETERSHPGRNSRRSPARVEAGGHDAPLCEPSLVLCGGAEQEHLQRRPIGGRHPHAPDAGPALRGDR